MPAMAKDLATALRPLQPGHKRRNLKRPAQSTFKTTPSPSSASSASCAPPPGSAWQAYSSWVPQGWPYAAPPPASRPWDFPQRQLPVGNFTVTAYVPTPDALPLVHEAEAELIERAWANRTDELQFIRKHRKKEWGVPEELPSHRWLPLPNVKPGRLAGERYSLVAIESDVEDYESVETYHDPARNLTWSYTKLKSNKPNENSEIAGENIGTAPGGHRSTSHRLETEEDKKFWMASSSMLPKRALDDGIVRHKLVADQLLDGVNKYHPGQQPWQLMCPGTGTGEGQLGSPQSFWPTVETRLGTGGVEMRMRRLGKSPLVVSEVGLGTMMFGSLVAQREATRLLDFAVEDCAVNFLDTSALYPLPFSAQAIGATERLISRWLRARPASFRQRLVIGTAVASRASRNRSGATRRTR
eukprot:GHVT01032775.1.p1 GENE.GHVT01032775.1~~GHVT01032775.1.p1  ORF type:complete len:471 (+),score=117.21 GHVT01032775.1:174-1415(+)